MQTSGKKSWTRWKVEHRQGQNTLNASSAVRLLYTVHIQEQKQTKDSRPHKMTKENKKKGDNR